MTVNSFKFLDRKNKTNHPLDLRSPAQTGLRRGLTLGWMRIASLMLADAGAIALARWLAVAWGTKLPSPWTMSPTFLLVVVVIKLGVIASSQLYKAGDHRRDYLGLIKALSLGEVMVLLIAFLYEPDQYISRSTFLLSWLLSILFCCTGRFLINAVTEQLRRQGAIRYPVFLIADTDEQPKSIALVEQQNCYTILGVANASALDRARREATLEYLRRLGVAEVFVSWSAIQNRLFLCWHFQTAGITVRILPSDLQSYFPKSEIWMLGRVPSLTVRGPVIVGGDYWVKRCFDVCSSLLLLVLFFPLYLAIALLIQMDSPGPVFFRQTRVGLHGKQFKVWKFRTMVANADQLQAILEAKNEMKDGVLFKMKDDPRVTRVGKFLRRYSLDELPQLFNVLLGEMSLVGPRPLPVRDVDKFQPNHFIRQEVLPGITGLWQVSGRSDIDNFEDAVRLDLNYITNWSIWLDLRILLKTVQVVLQRQGAY